MVSKEGYMDIQALYRNGMTVRAIARKLGLHRNTVKKHLMSTDFPQYRKTRRRESILEPYTPMIRDWLQEDDYRATWILERIRRNPHRPLLKTPDPLATIRASHRIGAPPRSAAVAAAANPSDQARSSSRSICPLAWIMRIAVACSSSGTRSRSASARIVPNDCR